MPHPSHFPPGSQLGIYPTPLPVNWIQTSMNSPLSDLGAIGFALAGFTFWVLGDTTIKLVGQSGLPPYEMVAFLGLFMCVFLTLYSLLRRELRLLRPRRVPLQLARASLDTVNSVCVAVALHHLSLTIFYILVFMAPMVIAMLSALFLGEGLSWRKWIAIFAGFIGVIIAVHPWGAERQGDWTGFIACMICVVCFSINMVWSRVITRTETPESLALFSGLVTAAVGAALMLFVHAEPLSKPLAAGLFAMGAFCAAGTLCFYIAVKHTSAANVSQYHYTQLVTGTIASYLIWRDTPGFFVLLGGALILASGLYVAAAAQNPLPLTEGN